MNDTNETHQEPTPIEQIPFLEGEFVSESYGMISGLAEQQKSTYHVYADKGRPDYRWLVAVVPNRGDHIYCGTLDKNKREQGFGGRTMDFIRENGDVVTLYGPWHSNSKALFEQTGVDVRNQHHTMGCVALYQDGEALEYPQTKYTQLIHVDLDPTLGLCN